jgi:hypothetical protein
MLVWIPMGKPRAMISLLTECESRASCRRRRFRLEKSFALIFPARTGQFPARDDEEACPALNVAFPMSEGRRIAFRQV